MNNECFRLVIEAGDHESLQNALELDPSLVNQTVVWCLGQTNKTDPLHYVSDCVFNGQLDDAKASEIAQLFLDHGALVNGTSGRESPLIGAASLGAEAVARVLIDAGADLERTSVHGAGALHWAASVGLPATVELLIERGANMEARCEDFGATPLYWAVFGFGPHGPNKKRDPLGSAKVLIEAGAEVDTRNRQGVSALECAKTAESTEMFELLRSVSHA